MPDGRIVVAEGNYGLPARRQARSGAVHVLLVTLDWMRLLVVGSEQESLARLSRRLLDEGQARGVVAVETAHGRTEAVRLAVAGGYDAIVLQATTGFAAAEVCRSIRQAGVWAPLIALVRGSEARDRVAALDSGADDCLGEPLDVAEVLARLQAALQRAVDLGSWT